MKNLAHVIRQLITLLILLVVVAPDVYSQEYYEEDSYYNHLYKVNKQWEKYKDACPEGIVSFQSDNERIQLHLKLVCKYLLFNKPEELQPTQIENRLELIYALENYADRGVFPTNSYHQKRTPYFVDNKGVHCAVGYLMAVSDNNNLVAQISREHNYDYLEDIKTPGVTKWAVTYGFTLDELKWIQPSYPPTTGSLAIANGANGPVREIMKDPYNDRLIITGDFYVLDDFACLGIGYFKDDQLNCFGNGLAGIVNGVIVNSQGIYAYGEIMNAGITYPLAFFDGNVWSYIEIPARTGATAVAGVRGHSIYDFEVVIEDPVDSTMQEIWYFDSTEGWDLKARVNGQINDIAIGNYDRAYVGAFNTVHLIESMAIDSTFSVNNILIKSNFFGTWSGSVDEVSDTVLTAIYVGNTLYLGGTCSSTQGSEICLSRYLNNTVQPLLMNSDFGVSGDYAINDLYYGYGSKLILGGEFNSPSWMYYGQNLGAYNLTYNSFEILAQFDAPVSTVVEFDNHLFCGGEFMNEGWTTNLNHLARIFDPLSIDPISNSDITTYPNPFTSEITIDGIAQEVKYTLINLSGQVVKEGISANRKVTGLDDLPSATYILKIETDNEEFNIRLIK
ncbi:MAG: T9SS type A sorting domain-containing protein [Crocinitomicaceae bacterium]|nr:T9SS type A sorting domain-containing protein [Crocinitomicaceae bacterium]